MICGWKGGRCAHDAILDTRSLKIERAKEALAYLDLSPLPSFPCPPRLASRDLRAGISLFRARNKLLPYEKWFRKTFRKLRNCARSMKHREGCPFHRYPQTPFWQRPLPPQSVLTSSIHKPQLFSQEIVLVMRYSSLILQNVTILCCAEASHIRLQNSGRISHQSRLTVDE